MSTDEIPLTELSEALNDPRASPTYELATDDLHAVDPELIDLTLPGEAMRLERDALGPRAITAQARYGIHTLRAAEALTISTKRLADYPAFVAALGTVKQAAARANLDAGVLAVSTARAIDGAAAQLRSPDAEVRASLIADPLAGGGSIAVHMNINEVVANTANLDFGRPFGAYDPVAPKTHVSASQSTADVCHTASRLAVAAGVELVQVALSDLIDSLLTQARLFSSVSTMARTCLQDAMVAPAHLLVEGSAAALARRLAGLARAAEPLAGVVLGGTVIGTGVGAPERYRDRVVPHLCAITDRNLFLHPDRASALQHSDDLVMVSAEVTALAGVAAKVAQDLRLLSSGPNGGFGEISLPHVLEGSSFFGNKRNPVVAESMINASLQVIGHDAAVRAAASRGELHLQVFDNVAVINLLDALALMARALEQFDHGCVRGIELDASRCAQLVAAVTPANNGIDGATATATGPVTVTEAR